MSGIDGEDKREFKGRVHRWADVLGVEMSVVAVRPMRRKWASCSSAGTISFSADLLDLERELTDYVIVHELLHLRVPNHGPLWKSLMRAHLGDYERLHSELRRVADDRSRVITGTAYGAFRAPR